MWSGSVRKARTGSDVTPPDGHDEGRRQAYLAALGIPLWSARQPLPGALPSAPLEFLPYTHAGGSLPAQSADREPERTPVPAAPEPLKPQERPRQESVQVSAREPVNAIAQAPDEDQERFPRFICRVQALAPGWSAVVVLGEAPDLSAQEHRLLANIASALGGDPTALQPCEHLRWPLNRNPALDHSAGAMVEWLAHALKLPPGRCIVFGEKMAAYVRAALPGHKVIAAPLLADLLAQPAVKRQLWQTLHG